MKAKDITKYVSMYENNREPDRRDASWDYCFNYFQEFKENKHIKDIVSPKYLQQSCLQLGFFLASWGMYKGKASLLQHSCHFLKGPLEVIVYDKRVWDIDADEYASKESRKLLWECGQKIRESLKNHITPCASDTLVTKIMLGVFGNVPAYDRFFVEAMRKCGIGGTFGLRSLKNLAEFYEDNHEEISEWSEKIKTIDFSTGTKTGRKYTEAKIIDMYGWMKRYNEINKDKANR